VTIEQPQLRDHIAAHGELVFGTILTRARPEFGYLFEPPRHLGEKKRTIDFYIELISFIQRQTVVFSCAGKDHDPRVYGS